MRLKASYTVEGSVIIPLFVLITVSLIMLDFYIHDVIIARCTALRTAMLCELEDGNDTDASGRDKLSYDDIKREAEEYLDIKTIALSGGYADIKEEKGAVKVICRGKKSHAVLWAFTAEEIKKESCVRKNAPDDFIREVSAVRNALK